jgi:type IV secretory pathway VirJ component
MLKKIIAIFLMFGCFLSDISAKAIIDKDLPLVITPAKKEGGNTMVLLISGDGGWVSFDKGLADEFAEQGTPVVGLNSLKYFWKKKTPDQTARDLEQVILQYSLKWKKDKIILCGFSFGAEVMPFIYNRFTVKLKEKVKCMQLFSPSYFTDFEIHVNDLLFIASKQKTKNVEPEVRKINIPVICFYGTTEEETPLKQIKMLNFKLVMLEGDHHYENQYAQMVKMALH